MAFPWIQRRQQAVLALAMVGCLYGNVPFTEHEGGFMGSLLCLGGVEQRRLNRGVGVVRAWGPGSTPSGG